MTEEKAQVELGTDTIEHLIDRLNYDIVGRNDLMNRKQREEAKESLREGLANPDAVAICGLPGAGKSHLAEELSKVYEAPVVSMGDAIREKFMAKKNRVHNSGEELGNFAAKWRNSDPEGIPKFVTEMAKQHDKELIIIDGVRSIIDFEVLNNYFEDFHLIEVKAEFYTRLQRLQKRGREGEAKFTATDLAERDEREMYELGFDALKNDNQIIVFKNGKEKDQFAIRLSEMVETMLPFEIQNGKPLGLDDELEAFRERVA